MADFIYLPDFQLAKETHPCIMAEAKRLVVDPEKLQTMLACRTYLEVFEITGFLHALKDLLLDQYDKERHDMGMIDQEHYATLESLKVRIHNMNDQD